MATPGGGEVNTMMRAWAVRCAGETCIVTARTSNRAKYITYQSAKYSELDVQWTAITVRRAKQFDALALFREIGPITPEVAKAMVAA